MALLRKIRFVALEFAFACFLIGSAITTFWPSYVTVPRHYHLLAQHGEGVNAKIIRCGYNLIHTPNFGDILACEVGYTFHGQKYSWVDTATSQFTDKRPGVSVAALVDTQNPKIVYTENEVNDRVNAYNPFALVLATIEFLLGLTMGSITVRFWQIYEEINAFKKKPTYDKKATRRHVFYSIVFTVAAITTWQVTYVYPIVTDSTKVSSSEFIVDGLNTFSILLLLFGLVSWAIRSLRSRR